MTSTSIHDVKKIEMPPPEEKYLASVGTYFRRQLNITTTRNGTLEFTLYADLRADLLTDEEKAAEAEKVAPVEPQEPESATDRDLELAKQTF
jgi:hypothetical protein